MKATSGCVTSCSKYPIRGIIFSFQQGEQVNKIELGCQACKNEPPGLMEYDKLYKQVCSPRPGQLPSNQFNSLQWQLAYPLSSSLSVSFLLLLPGQYKDMVVWYDGHEKPITCLYLYENSL